MKKINLAFYFCCGFPLCDALLQFTHQRLQSLYFAGITKTSIQFKSICSSQIPKEGCEEIKWVSKNNWYGWFTHCFLKIMLGKLSPLPLANESLASCLFCSDSDGGKLNAGWMKHMFLIASSLSLYHIVDFFNSFSYKKSEPLTMFPIIGDGYYLEECRCYSL